MHDIHVHLQACDVLYTTITSTNNIIVLELTDSSLIGCELFDCTWLVCASDRDGNK